MGAVYSYTRGIMIVVPYIPLSGSVQTKDPAIEVSYPREVGENAKRGEYVECWSVYNSLQWN